MRPGSALCDVMREEGKGKVTPHEDEVPTVPRGVTAF